MIDKFNFFRSQLKNIKLNMRFTNNMAINEVLLVLKQIYPDEDDQTVWGLSIKVRHSLGKSCLLIRDAYKISLGQWLNFIKPYSSSRICYPEKPGKDKDFSLWSSGDDIIIMIDPDGGIEEAAGGMKLPKALFAEKFEEMLKLNEKSTEHIDK